MREYRCQLCGDTAVVGDQCPRCLVPMIDEERANKIRFGARSLRNKWIKYFALAYIVAHVVVNVAINALFGPFIGWNYAVALMLGCLTLTLVIAALLYVMGKGGNVRAARRIERWPANRPITSIGEACEGHVAIRGRVRSGDAVFEAGGRRAVAGTRIRHEGHLSPALITRATEFTIEDENGERAVVRASEVIVIGGIEANGERLVPDGALVEIAGNGVRNMTADREGGYRADVRTLELSGSPESPLVIRVIEMPAKVTPEQAPRVEAIEPSGVRVAVESEPETLPEGEREDEHRTPAKVSARS